MAIIQVAEVIHCDGWSGTAADVRDSGMLDDATYLLSGLRGEGEGASIALALEPELPDGGSELVVRCQRMCQGRVSGTGTPAPLTVVVHQGEKQLLVETIRPGGSWREDRFGIKAPGEGKTPLTVELLVPGGERQVAVSRLRIEARDTTTTQAPEIVDAPLASGEVCVVVEPVDPGEVAAAVEDGAACGLVPPAVEEPEAQELEAQEPEVLTQAPESVKAPSVQKRKRARHGDGTYRGDDKGTAEVNEAWVEE